ncbi:hypothetical protein SAMN05421686_1222 [Thalassolituus maritimus]|uniref:Uncharacterized protein n=1 Tax=Thalassolituus maritimus TaxID=484498 RepID=A0A1N7QD04_9GAMM|nr:hypothetical protein [Thalassolituus maritimus]SIT20639.1 hypothetical protein SAMN05421686_1222 [Thalassolituus maritimus]
MKTNAGMLKQFYDSERYWPKGYTVYDLLIIIEGHDDLTEEFENIGEYIRSLADSTSIEIISGVLNWELDDSVDQRELFIRDQFTAFSTNQ